MRRWAGGRDRAEGRTGGRREDSLFVFSSPSHLAPHRSLTNCASLFRLYYRLSTLSHKHTLASLLLTLSAPPSHPRSLRHKPSEPKFLFLDLWPFHSRSMTRNRSMLPPGSAVRSESSR
eukprot:1875367-Rhodomonas_salina.2